MIILPQKRLLAADKGWGPISVVVRPRRYSAWLLPVLFFCLVFLTTLIAYADQTKAMSRMGQVISEHAILSPQQPKFTPAPDQSPIIHSTNSAADPDEGLFLGQFCSFDSQQSIKDWIRQQRISHQSAASQVAIGQMAAYYRMDRVLARQFGTDPLSWPQSRELAQRMVLYDYALYSSGMQYAIDQARVNLLGPWPDLTALPGHKALAHMTKAINVLGTGLGAVYQAAQVYKEQIYYLSQSVEIISPDAYLHTRTSTGWVGQGTIYAPKRGFRLDYYREVQANLPGVLKYQTIETLNTTQGVTIHQQTFGQTPININVGNLPNKPGILFEPGRTVETRTTTTTVNQIQIQGPGFEAITIGNPQPMSWQASPSASFPQPLYNPPPPIRTTTPPANSTIMVPPTRR